ncbi:MAG: serine/threonine-protein kinase RsbW [Actinomycetota bacterium]|jgi:serine/threonine-protein kinase RsbW
MTSAAVEPAVAVTLVVSAANDNISFARLTAVQVASKVGFDYDAIEDVRIAVSELCGTLITAAVAGSELTIVCRGDSTGLTITGRAPAPEAGVTLEPDELSEQVLDAVTDQHDFSCDGAEVQFSMFRSKSTDS